MASSLNSFCQTLLGGTSEISGFWEDVQDYSSVAITVNTEDSGRLHVDWTNNGLSDADPIKRTTTLLPAGTKVLEFDHACSWMRIQFYYDNTEGERLIKIFTINRKTPCMFKITDACGTEVDIKYSSFLSSLTDFSGNILASTNYHTGKEALYTNFVDASGVSLYSITSGHALCLRDSIGTTLAVASNSLKVHQTDMCGHSQAGSIDICGAVTLGKGLYIAPDIDSTLYHNYNIEAQEATSNALFVHFVDSMGRNMGEENAITCDMVDNIAFVKAFDISCAITKNIVAIEDFKGSNVVLHSLHAYNDAPSTTWLKLYNMTISQANSFDSITDANKLYYNLAIPAKATRDILFPKGCVFPYGLYFRATLDNGIDSSLEPTAPMYVSGCYNSTLHPVFLG